MRTGAKVRLKSDSPQELREKFKAANDEAFGEVDTTRKPGICRIKLFSGGVEGSYIIGPNQHYIDVLEKYLEEAP